MQNTKENREKDAYDNSKITCAGEPGRPFEEASPATATRKDRLATPWSSGCDPDRENIHQNHGSSTPGKLERGEVRGAGGRDQ